MSSDENYPSDPLAHNKSTWPDRAEQKMLEQLDRRLERSREIGEREEQEEDERRLADMKRVNWEEGWRSSEVRYFDY